MSWISCKSVVTKGLSLLTKIPSPHCLLIAGCWRGLARLSRRSSKKHAEGMADHFIRPGLYSKPNGDDIQETWCRRRESFVPMASRRLGVWRFRIGWDQNLYLCVAGSLPLLLHSLQWSKHISGRFICQVYGRADRVL